jgi:hypothetical protein
MTSSAWHALADLHNLHELVKVLSGLDCVEAEKAIHVLDKQMLFFELMFIDLFEFQGQSLKYENV